MYSDTPQIHKPTIAMTLRERVRIILYALYNFLASGFMAALTYLLVNDILTKDLHGFKEWIFPIVFGIFAMTFLIRSLRCIMDWKDDEVEAYQGVLQYKNFGGIINPLAMQFIVVNNKPEISSIHREEGLSESQQESFDVRLRDYLHYKKGDELIMHIAPRVKSVLSIELIKKT